MGHSNSWIGVCGLSRAEVLARLDLLDTRNPDDGYSAELAVAELKNGWVVLRCRRFAFPTPKRLSRLSRGAEVVSGQMEEHVMVSAAHGFQDGAQSWSVVHDPGAGLYSLVVEGAPPPALSSISASLMKKQDAAGGQDADVDFIFDVVPELIAKICGYRPDQGEPPAFTEVEQIRRGLFRTLAGMLRGG